MLSQICTVACLSVIAACVYGTDMFVQYGGLLPSTVACLPSAVASVSVTVTCFCLSVTATCFLWSCGLFAQ